MSGPIPVRAAMLCAACCLAMAFGPVEILAQSQDPIADLRPVLEKLVEKAQGSAVAPRLIQDLRKETNNSVKVRIVHALGGLASSSPEVVPALAQAHQSETDYRIRQAVCRTLGELGPAAGEAIGVVFRASLLDRALDARESCLEASGKIGLDSRAFDSVSDLIQDYDKQGPYARQNLCRAAESLGPAAGKLAFIFLRGFLDGNGSVRESCGKALADAVSAGLSIHRDVPQEQLRELFPRFEAVVRDMSQSSGFRARYCAALGMLGWQAGPVLSDLVAELGKDQRNSGRNQPVVSACSEALEKVSASLLPQEGQP